MKLPEIVLDDRGFQYLVNEARLRIHRRCPEWTEHNVSDPGVTLIELFAWMTDILIYRLNRVPEKVHVALLDLLGIGLAPPTSAATDLRFRLSAPAADPVTIPAIETQVGTLRTTSEEAIVFSTREECVIPALRLNEYQLQRGDVRRDVGVARGQARPSGQDQLAFGAPPAPGDAIYLGFDHSLAQLVIQLDVECSQAGGPGVDPEDPPLRWEASTGDGPDDWTEVAVLEDKTGGFNYGSGRIEVEVPPDARSATRGPTRSYWLRCRVDQSTRSGAAGAYSHPPEIYAISAGAVGARVAAFHAELVTREALGEGDGSRGQTFQLRHAPVIAPEPTERLEVRDPDEKRWRQWQPCDSFVESDKSDRHYHLDSTSGEVTFGPAIRLPDGEWRAFGAVPAKGAIVRFSRYRHGGGRRGNVAAGRLNSLKVAIPGIASVTNPEAAVGGVDPETLESARQRAAMDIRTRYRAVTAADYEFLCEQASPQVARAVCLEPGSTGVIPVRILPRVNDADRRLLPHELRLQSQLRLEVARYLDERRMIGMTVDLDGVRLRGVTVVVNVQSSPSADSGRVEEDVRHVLYRFLNPLVGGSPDGRGDGWEFGRALNQGELFGVVQGVEGVEFVKILRIYETDLDTGKQAPKQAPSHIHLAPDELVASAEHVVKAEPRER